MKRVVAVSRIGFVAAAVSVVLASCGGGHGKAATQVVAKVNGDEISVHQVNFALQSIPNVPESQAKVIGKQVLEKLVDQQVLIQKAIEKKLDRDPRVVQTIETARRQILAQAYLEQSMNSAIKPTSVEIADYYDKHPELFGERRIFQFQEIQFATTPERTAKLTDMLKAGTNPKEILEWLKAANVAFNNNVVSKPAEALPLEYLPTFHKLKDGQIVTLPGANSSMVVEALLQSKTVPLDRKQAEPVIERYLNNQKRQQLAEAELKQLRAVAKVEYVGDFAKGAADAPAAPVPPEAAGDKGKNEKSAIDKGLSGLK